VLHELYFANLGGESKAGGKVLDLIKQWFGSYEQWEDEFKRTANALSGGSGWVMFAQNVHTESSITIGPGEINMHNVPMSRPIVVLDMYEHAYDIDYGAVAGQIPGRILKNVNWEE
jgi:superoxide dismutase, Fe-Mn family